LFFEQFGKQHSFLSHTSDNNFQVFSMTGMENLTEAALPVDYIYAPDSWGRRLTDNQLKNILLSLKHSPADFLIVSASRAEFPIVGISSLGNHTIFSKDLGLSFPNGKTRKTAIGRIARLLPYDAPVTEANAEEMFHQDIAWQPVPSWPPRYGIESVTNQRRPQGSLTTSFIPKFHKQKPMVFVWSIFMVVGGAERNAIEAMRHLQDRYHFVVITMERPHQSQGSLHHQLKGIAEAVYDLGELAPYETYLGMLNDLKSVYAPDVVWITNGSPWLSDNALSLRELFEDIPIVDQQVYDVNRGWILRYREPGVQSFDRFVAINKKIQDTFIKRFGMDSELIDLIYHAVDTHRFNPSTYTDTDRAGFLRKYDLDGRQKVFIFAGRLTAQKRPVDFLQLARRRQDAGDEAFFVLVGDGDLAPVVDDFIRHHELQNVRRISFIENMAELFSIASGLVLTSEFEGMPIVILEALSMGLPVLATDVGDVKLMLDEYCAGLTFGEIGDLDCLERTYERWAGELSSYETNARANAAAVRQRFSGESVAEQYAASWERARETTGSSSLGMPRSAPGLVSVIIPSYNHADYLTNAIDSVLDQTYENIEVIVIDDGSSDDSVNYLRQIKDPRFNFYCQPNQGAHVAINRGLGLASGEFLAILNSDDAFHPERVKELTAEFRNDPELELVATWIEVIDGDGRQLAIKEGWHNLEPWPIAHPELSFEQTDDFGLNLLRGNFVASTSNILMRRSLFERIGGMRKLRFAHDWDFLMRAASSVKCKLVPKPLLKYRVHETNTIKSNRAWMLFDICWVLAANLHRFEDAKLFNGSDLRASMANLITLYESINLQGNDKVFWAMRAFIQSLRSQGIEHPEELLLEDEFRERLVQYISV
jgi:glycosyltransferase involved in cell wall biosynthesis